MIRWGDVLMGGENVNNKDHSKAPEKLRTLVYILAPSYTGSTLLTFLLSQHGNIATIGELKATARGDLDTYFCSCGLLQRECGFWKKVTKEMQEAGTSFNLYDFGTHFCVDTPVCDRLFRAGIRGRSFEAVRNLMLQCLPGCRRRLYEVWEQNRQIIDVICNLQEGEVFLDASKDPIRLKLLHLAGYWNLKVIYLIRDGRGATSSYMRHYSVSMETAAKEWRYTHQECDRMVRGLGNDKYIKIHYEELCEKPEATMARICDFLGLGADSNSLRLKSSEHHILGNQMRLKSTDRIRLDERWKDTLTRKDLETFERIAGKINRRYCYQ